MKYRFISDHRERANVGLMCKVLNISRSGYYAWLKRPRSRRSKENRKLADHIRITHAKSRKIYGAPRIYRKLRENGISCSQNRVARIMKQEGIRGVVPRKFKATTDSKHNFPVAPNLLNRNFDVKEPHRVWLADITYISTGEGWLYLSAVMDLGSRRIIGWAMSDRMKRKLTLDALMMAICNHPQTNGIIHHSDRGSQYASEDYQKKLQSHGLVGSMSRKGNCWDNAPMESFFHTLKTEWVYGFKYRTRQEATSNIFDYIEIFYNRQRSHSKLGYITPCQYEEYRMAA